MTRHILYSFRRCPYAMRARMALIVSGIECALREVELKNKPAEMIDASPKATVPVLVPEGGAVLEESLDIMFWVLRQRDPEHWLAPETGSEAEMLTLIEENDGPFKHHLDRYKYSTRYEGADALEHRRAGRTFLTQLNERLAECDYLFGKRRALADVAIFPFVRQFANTDRDWFDAEDLPRLQGWLARCLDSDLFKRAMAKHKPWVSGEPEPTFP